MVEPLPSPFDKFLCLPMPHADIRSKFRFYPQYGISSCEWQLCSYIRQGGQDSPSKGSIGWLQPKGSSCFEVAGFDLKGNHQSGRTGIPRGDIPPKVFVEWKVFRVLHL